MSLRSLNINGEIIPENRSGLSVQNRSFRFGDGLFESIKVVNGNPLFLEDHFGRLTKGIKVLEFEIPAYFDLAYFRKEILKLLPINGLTRGGRVRFSAFRKGSGFYVPNSNDFGFVVEAYDGEDNQYVLNSTGLNLGLYKEIPLSSNKISPFKTSNCLPYVLAGLDAKKRGFDDVILINNEGNLCEATSSNFFVFINGILYTPPIKDGCTSGIMRKKIIQISKKMNIGVVETSISSKLLHDASEIFLTNAISGLRWVKAYDKSRYFHKLSEKLTAELNKLT